MITQEYLRQILDYDPETGIFRWKQQRSNIAIGDVAGSLRDTGYIIIGVDGRLCRAHHLAWLWMTGEWPKPFLDHKNTIKSDNRWDNLRKATKSQNMANRGAPKNSTTGLKGVYYYKAYRRWASQIWKDGNAYFVGYFDSKEDAHEARLAKHIELFGEFAR